MKNLKKVLALVLAFACAFTMLAGAVVYPDVPAGSDYSEAITMLSDLGVITGDTDGKYHPENTITRAEACALIARLLTGETDVSKYTGASNFPDVSKASWYESAVGYCVANGIVRGYPDGTFKPAVQITDAEFVTMLVRAMGYETSANPLSYPYGYISAAQTAGLLDGVTVVPASGALRGEDAQMLYNALFADYARGAKFINTTHGTTVETYPTIAEQVFNLTRAAVGTWNDDDDVLDLCKAHTWVITGNVLKVGEVDMIEALPIKDGETELYDKADKKVESYVFEYKGDVSALKGYQVELWGEGPHGEPEYKTADNGDKVYSYDWEIKAVKTVKGQTAYAYTPADEDLPDVDNDDVVGFVGGTKIAKESRTIAWGADTIKESVVEDALQTKNSASYNLVDWDSDGSVDFVVGDLYNYYKVEAITTKAVKLVGMNGEKFTLDQDGETDVTIDGQKYTIKAEFADDLEEGDIIEVTTEDVAAKKKIESTWTVEVVEADTKELTKVDTKENAYFDDELIHDAEAYDKVQYFFGENDDTYASLNEKDTADNWDLYLDANGFIIFMEPASENWTGYLYVTGARNGDSSTGSKHKLAMVSGVNEKNEYLEDVELVKDADADYYDEDERSFGEEDGPMGRVFHYALNDDGQITKMVEVAKTEAENYTFTDKTDAVRINNYNYWLDDADVIFAVATTGDYAGQYTDNTVVTDNNKHLVDDDYYVNDKDLSHKNVVAVTVDEIPDINGDKTEDMGIRYDVTKIKDEGGAVVLGVDTLRYFSNTTVKAGLVTYMAANKDDTYDVTAYIPGMEETDFVTIDEDDVIMAGDTKLETLRTILTKGTTGLDAKYGIYCEIEFNKDGKISALSPMNDPYVGRTAIRETNEDGLEINTIYNDMGATIPATYEVTRVVVNKVTTDKALTVSAATATKEDNKVYTVENAQFSGAYDIDDSTGYFKITDKKVKMTSDSVLNPWLDGFNKGFGVEAGSAEELAGYIRNYEDKYEDEYVVADVVLDGNDVVAVYYYDKLVGEYGYLDGTLKVENNDDDFVVTYGANIDAEVTCNDTNLKAGTAEIALYKVTTVDGERVETEVKTVKGMTADFGVLDVGTYVVRATGVNKATEKGDRQAIGHAVEFTVNAADFGNAKITVDPKNNQQVVLSDVDVVGLDESNFVVFQNSTKLTEDMYTMKYDDVADTYNFIIKDGVSTADDFKIVISHANYNDKTVEYVGVEETVKVPAINVGGAAADPAEAGTLEISYTIDGVTVPQTVKINIFKSQDTTTKVAKAIETQFNKQVSNIVATATGTQVVFETVNGETLAVKVETPSVAGYSFAATTVEK